MFSRRFVLFAGLVLATGSLADEQRPAAPVVAQPGLFEPLTEPPCSYCSTQHRKGLIANDDRVIAWIRGVHNGGAIPIRIFLSKPRVINDTYGLFFYDPDGGYIAAYKKDYGYKFHGWRRGVMVVQGPDGSLWSALTGVAFDGPKKGQRLERIPSMVTDWSYWLMLHPESTAYDLFDGKRYQPAPLPTEMSQQARDSMDLVDARLDPLADVVGIELSGETKAFPIDKAADRACFTDTVAGQPVAVFWHGPTRSAVAFRRELNGKTLTFYADKISPETAPIKDRETGTRWTMAGRAVDGPLRGQELEWVDSILCRWYAWAAEHPKTLLYKSNQPTGKSNAAKLQSRRPLPKGERPQSLLLVGDNQNEKPQSPLSLVGEGQDEASSTPSPLVREGQGSSSPTLLVGEGQDEGSSTPSPLVREGQGSSSPTLLVGEGQGSSFPSPLVGEGQGGGSQLPAGNPKAADTSVRIKGILLSAAQATSERLAAARKQGRNAVVLSLAGESPADSAAEKSAASAIQQSGLALYYWIEIGRCPSLAEQHPLWMASLQGHTEWRRLFPNLPQPTAGEVVKNYPWVPILYAEAFDAHKNRVAQLLADKPPAKGIFLNDLQAAPSACGCGNGLCRWTSDYGPIRTAKPLGDDAAAKFVAEVQRLAPQAAVIPVWTTECEEHDATPDGLCAGVGCYRGTCWRVYTKQLAPLAEKADKFAVLCLYRTFQRDTAHYGKPAGWIRTALDSFATMPPKYKHSPVPASRLIAILEGWNDSVSPTDLTAQIAQAESVSPAGWIIAEFPIDQSWQPRIVPIPTQ